MTAWTLITGASDGLGVEFARLAAKHGRAMILTARSEDKLNTLAGELRSRGAEVVVIPADLNDLAEVDRLWSEATEGRQIDFVINNAGLGRNGPFAGGGDAGWAMELSSIDVNMRALTRLMHLAIPHMTDAGTGRILNVGSLAGFLPGPNMAIYHATKAYVLSLSEAVAHELRKTRVTVTALCPGATRTGFFAKAEMQGIRLLKLSPPASAHDVAATGWQAAMAGRRVVVPGLLNKLSALLPRLAPRRVVTAMTGVFMSKS
ncbi:hypothetical protein A8B82_10005 [Sulfitobacter sp. EhC04]|uniref:SDR family NAD(P)-dependent oxidoreductase n=1 Tax=Sulfitobacter sp. EhC04 TaxID=1849168 RepID=UPI0007F52738|nr:SDR family oxidoreductase [Sulfitobacter sp. EhC04]OAN78085.1 hypothetical protein A8B82_10005 [Sulfitobacter sp. EhC04]